LAFLPAAQLSALVRARRLSPVELVRVYLDRIEQLNPRLHAFLTVTGEAALADAHRAAREIARGRWRGPMHGIAVALKDNIYTRGVRTTAGSKVLESFVPEEDAAVVLRLREAGAILLGKTHLHEFAYGVTSNNAFYGPARNPYDPERIPGGSSGGSAIAVAAGLCALAIGTDTGGSIRIPAALCGVVGYKPAFGAVPMDGIVTLCASLDHAGPIARRVEDAALADAALRGVRETRLAARRPVRGLRLGWPEGYFFERLDAQVAAAVDAARRLFAQRGVRMVPVRLPQLEAANRASTPIALAEAYQFHRAAGYFPARAAEYSDDVRGRLEKGEAITAADYLDAKSVVAGATREFCECAGRVDALLVPTVPVSAPRIGEDRVSVAGAMEDTRAALLRLCRPANLWGAPAISIPCGATGEGLPIGLQLIGFTGREDALFALAQFYERETRWHERRPVLP